MHQYHTIPMFFFYDAFMHFKSVNHFSPTYYITWKTKMNVVKHASRGKSRCTFVALKDSLSRTFWVRLLLCSCTLYISPSQPAGWSISFSRENHGLEANQAGFIIEMEREEYSRFFYPLIGMMWWNMEL